jgi:lipid-binding SYLF domain-containing protein
LARFALVSACLVLASVPGKTAGADERLGECSASLAELLAIPEGIPQSILDKAECVIILPSVKRFALGIGGSYGKGALICRRGDRFDGAWGAPAMVRLEGGNIGFQVGGQATDYLLLVMNPRGVESILKSKTKLGVDAAAVAGPKGRSAEAATDAYMTAEILSYSRSRGLFAGVSVAGSTLRQDSNANRNIYGRELPVREIALGENVPIPEGAAALVNLLQKASPRNESLVPRSNKQ